MAVQRYYEGMTRRFWTFPEEVAKLRACLGWSQAQLGKEVGVTKLTIRRWEHGYGAIKARSKPWNRLKWLIKNVQPVLENFRAHWDDEVFLGVPGKYEVGHWVAGKGKDVI